MCVLSIKVPIRKKYRNLFNDPRIYIYVCVCVCVVVVQRIRWWRDELQNWPVRESFIVRRPVHRCNPTLSYMKEREREREREREGERERERLYKCTKMKNNLFWGWIYLLNYLSTLDVSVFRPSSYIFFRGRDKLRERFCVRVYLKGFPNFSTRSEIRGIRWEINSLSMACKSLHHATYPLYVGGSIYGTLFNTRSVVLSAQQEVISVSIAYSPLHLSLSLYIYIYRLRMDACIYTYMEGGW